jgi:hypothetical protein
LAGCGDQPKTYQKLEADRKRLNDEADKYYSSDTAGKRSINTSDATAVAQRAAADAIRDVLYGDNAGNPGCSNVLVLPPSMSMVSLCHAEIRLRVGRLIDIRDHFEKAVTRAEDTGD